MYLNFSKKRQKAVRYSAEIISQPQLSCYSPVSNEIAEIFICLLFV